MKILILGASYGSLLSTKLLMAGHDVTLICREQTAELINADGTIVRLKLKDETESRLIRSIGLPGNVDAVTPENARPESYDLVGLAMQEPQYGSPAVKELMSRVAKSGRPCLSIMNMPPLPYLKRVPKLADKHIEQCFTDPSVWEGFDPVLMSLCSPDPQAFRPPEEAANFLHVGLPTNFKASEFGSPAHNELLRQLAEDIAEVRLDGKDVPVKLRVHASLFVPMAKWSMLMTGNYRCVTSDGANSIYDAVHSDIEASQTIYEWVDQLARKLGADAEDQVPFEKYAAAAKGLLKPSSGARAIMAGATQIERVDKLIQVIGSEFGMQLDAIDHAVETVNNRLLQNRHNAA